MSQSRLVAVLGYSAGSDEALHDICDARLRRAEREVRANDVVLLSGWGRGRRSVSEADLMAKSWRARCRQVILDPSARSTLANVRGAAAVARALPAQEVVLVTSAWHGRRASALLRAALRGSGCSVTLAVTDERVPARTRARELVCWAFVPVAALTARRR